MHLEITIPSMCISYIIKYHSSYIHIPVISNVLPKCPPLQADVAFSCVRRTIGVCSYHKKLRLSFWKETHLVRALSCTNKSQLQLDSRKRKESEEVCTLEAKPRGNYSLMVTSLFIHAAKTCKCKPCLSSHCATVSKVVLSSSSGYADVL